MARLEDAVAALKGGRAVVFPTDTVYGVGVAVRYAATPQEIFDLKRRDAEKPVAWLVGGIDDLDRYGADVSSEARALARDAWPGALTLIVKASDEVPGAFRSRQGTVGLRMPASEVALALIREVGPIATSSANVSGEAAPHAFSDVAPALLDAIACAVEDEADFASGSPSTVIDCSRGKVVTIRQGGIMSDRTFSVPLDFTSHDGRTRINAKLWTSSRFGSPGSPGVEAPKAVVQIVHGMAEHVDRYDELAEYLVECGFVVCAEDHIGHGKSAAPHERGHMPAHGGKDILLGDVRTLYRMVSGLFPGVPYVMYGHSMGSFIVRAYIARYGGELSACVLSGTGNPAPALSRAGRSLARLLAAVRGETYRSKMIDNMGAGGYGRKISDARTPLDWLSTDPAVVDAYLADDLCGFMFTVGGYATLLDLTAECVSPEHAALVPDELPVLFVAGDGDPVGEMGKAVEVAARLYRGAGVQRVDVRIYPGMRHEIHNEFGRELVYGDIVAWLDAQLNV